MKHHISSALAAIAVLSQSCIAGAAEIKVLAALGIQEVLQDVKPKFESASGHRLL